jgi:hypothetical protein
MTTSKIVWTKTDEAPALATYALLPVIQKFTKGTGIEAETRDISLAGRIIAIFPERLTDDQRIPDHLTQLGDLAKTPEANIIKLPNISASIPQLQAAIKELQEKGYDIPDYPEEPKSEAEKALQERFSVVLGSAVNPVLRQGNSDRRPAASVKKFAQKNPHKMMQQWPESGSKARVAHMSDKDFYSSENSTTIEKTCEVNIEFVAADGKATVMKKGLPLLEGEVIDTAVMNVAALRKFYAEQIEAAKKDGVLLSLHLKATMMKVSDPIMFGHCVSVYYKDALEKHAEALNEIGVNLNNGLADVYGHHQPARAQQHHRRRVDAQRRPRRRQDVEQRRRASGLYRHGPRSLLCDHVRGNPRGRQEERAVRPLDDGRRFQRRPDGPEGGGVRLSRQDLRGACQRRVPRRRCLGPDAVGADRGARGHLQDVSGEGCPDPGLGRPGRQEGQSQRSARDILAGRSSGARCADHREGEQVPARLRHQRPRHSHHEAGRGDEVLAGEDPQGRGYDRRHR